MAERPTSASSRRTKPSSDDAIGHFVIDKEIGKGSFAQVYSGRHKVSLIPPLPVVHGMSFVTAVISLWRSGLLLCLLLCQIRAF
jgi:hypothetical protein